MEDDPKPIPSETSGLSAFWQELRRRKVVRVAIVYAVVAWLLAQVAITVFPHVGLPDWTPTLIIWILIIGFPIALIMAWAFEVTPEGIKSASDVQTGGSVAPAKGNRLNYVTLGLVVLVLTFLIVDRYLFSPVHTQVSNGSSSEALSLSSSIKRYIINLEEGHELALADLAPLGVGRRSLTVSPDGTHLAYVVDIGGISQLFLRPMGELEARPIPGTEGAFSPFFSPNGEWIGYLTETQVMKVSIRGGLPRTLAAAGNVYGAAWGPDDTIVFAEREGLFLTVIPADGGDKKVLFNGYLRNPEFLPDGSGILFASLSDPPAKIMLYLLDSGKLVPIIEQGDSPHYISTGHILFTSDSGISAVPFDLASHAVTGPRVPILENARREGHGVSQLDVSNDGLLVYIPGVDMGILQPVWVSRSGIEKAIPLPSQRYGTLRLSPDDSQVAFLIQGPETDIWIYDFERAVPARRLTVGGHKRGMVWSPDGQTIAFAQLHAGREDIDDGIFQQRVDGRQVSTILQPKTRWINPESWILENMLVYITTSENGVDTNIWTKRLDNKENPELFVGTQASEWGASMSPDGRFVAYTSDESGQYQIYVKPYPPTETQWMISAGYGEEPVWSPNGNEIFYRRGNEWLRVPVQTEPVFKAKVPEVLFEGPYFNVDEISYSVSADGQRFLLLKTPEQPPATKIHVVANWFDELNRLVPPADD